ncbi:MAG: flavodoxin family protein [Selenomonas artemidis]|nr:flavodoxin family protein [Selenomonas artemidis]
MNILIFNGSPRKKGNTMKMIEAYRAGVQSVVPDASIEIVHLYGLNYKGCLSCFGCKRDNSPSYGHCVINDDLKPLFEKTAAADGLVFATPIYFGEMTGQLKSFLERLLFQYHSYEKDSRSLAPKKVPTDMIYTMNVTNETKNKLGYDSYLCNMENRIGHIFTRPKIYNAFNTYQFSDYSLYRAEVFSEPNKAAYRNDRLPEELSAAFSGGAAMAKAILTKY